MFLDQLEEYYVQTLPFKIFIQFLCFVLLFGGGYFVFTVHMSLGKKDLENFELWNDGTTHGFIVLPYFRDRNSLIEGRIN